MSKPRVGVLSFAHYHANFWSEAFSADPRATLAGIWDADPERGAAAAARFGTMYEPALEALLSRVDAVAITSETSAHRVLIEAACAHGLAILCEKPLATTLADARLIEAAVTAAGVLFVQSFPKRLDPASLALRRLVTSGELGRIWLARIRHGHNHGADPAFRRGWWTDPALSGGGTLIDEGIHAVDFLLWLFGPPIHVTATLANATLGLDVEDAAVACFAWEDGLLADIATGWTFQAASDSVELYGTAATVLLGGVDLASRPLAGSGPYLRVAARGATDWTGLDVVPGFVAGGFHQRGAVAFIDSLCGDAPPYSTLADGGAALRLVTAAYRAAREGRRIDLSD